jgi:hypothetical protein
MKDGRGREWETVRRGEGRGEGGEVKAWKK